MIKDLQLYTNNGQVEYQLDKEDIMKYLIC